MCAVTGIVVSIGLIEDRVEIVIGAMLISLFLGPLTQTPSVDKGLDKRVLIHNAALFVAGISCIMVASFLSTLVYNFFIGLYPSVLSSELESRAMDEADFYKVIFVNVAISVPSGFLYTFVRKANIQIESLRHSSHVIGIAISTALAPPAGAVGILFLAYVKNQQDYLKLYNINIPYVILLINTWGIVVGVTIAYILAKLTASIRKIIVRSWE